MQQLLQYVTRALLLNTNLLAEKGNFATRLASRSSSDIMSDCDSENRQFPTPKKTRLEAKVSSILTIKLGSSSSSKFEPTQEMIELAKTATMEYNRAHSSKNTT